MRIMLWKVGERRAIIVETGNEMPVGLENAGGKMFCDMFCCEMETEKYFVGMSETNETNYVCVKFALRRAMAPAAHGNYTETSVGRNSR